MSRRAVLIQSDRRNPKPHQTTRTGKTVVLSTTFCRKYKRHAIGSSLSTKEHCRDGTPSELQEKFHSSESIALQLKAPVANAMTEIFPKIKSLPASNRSNMVRQAEAYTALRLCCQGKRSPRGLVPTAVSEGWCCWKCPEGTSLEEVFHG